MDTNKLTKKTSIFTKRASVFLFLLIILLTLLSRQARAQSTTTGSGAISITALATNFTENFNTLANSGSSGIAIPSGWYFSETGTNRDATYGVGTGSSNSGDTYSFGVTSNSERTFGTLISGSLTSTIGAKFTNNSGSTINSITISYTGKTWRVATANRTDRLDFQYSTSAANIAAATTGYTDVDALDYTNTAQAATGSGSLQQSTSISSTITGLSIANGASFFIRWLDFDVTGTDDGMGIDDFTISAAATPSNAISAPTITGPYCVTAGTGASISSIAVSSTGTFTSGNVYTAQLSDNTGTFATTPPSIGTVSNTSNSATITNAVIPANTPTGTGYKIRIISNNPATTGIASSAFTVNLAANSVTPSAAQTNVAAGTDAATLTVTEQSTPASRVWAYGTSSGSYTTTTGSTGLTYTPNFSGTGTYYVVCKSTYTCPSTTVISNEVVITVVNPSTPSLSSLSPSSAVAGSGAFTLIVNGSNFYNGISTVIWNGSNRATTYVSNTQLTAAITAADIASVGTATVDVVTTGASASTTAKTFTISTAVAPGAPTIGTATAGNGQATITFTAPGSNGGATITSYTATSSPGGLTGTLNQAGSGTITVNGLTNGATYTFTVTATNGAGTSVASAASNAVTPKGTTATVIAGWDASTLPGGTNNFGPSPFAATVADANTIVGGLTRGSNVTTSGSAASGGWGGTGWDATSAAAGVTAGAYFTFTLTANSNYRLSLSSISKFDYRRSGSGAQNAAIQYQINSGTFVTITTVSFSSSASGGASIAATDLSSVAALQNLPSTSTVTFRIVPYGATSSAGTFYIYDVSGSAANDFEVTGFEYGNAWIGGNSNWNNTNNWLTGTVPNSSTADATISTGTPALDIDVAVRNITLGTGTNLTLGSHTLTINGTFSGSTTGTLKGSSTSGLVLAGTAGTLYFASVGDTLKTFTLNSGATASLGTTLNIASWQVAFPGTLTIGGTSTSHAVLTTNDRLTLKSNDSSTAMVAAIPEDLSSGAALGSIIGNVVVERDVHSPVNTPNGQQNGAGGPGTNTVINNGLRAWRLLTAPVKSAGSPTIQAAWQNGGTAYNAGIASTQGVGTLISATTAGAGIDYVSNPSLYSWDPAQQAFSAMTTTTGAISNGNYGTDVNAGNTGYFIFIRGDRNLATTGNPNYGGLIINNTTLNPKGTLITGKQTYTVKQATNSNNAFTLIGNPYAAPINLNTLTLSNVQSQFYIWDPNVNKVGSFVLVIPGTPAIFIPDPHNLTQYVQSGQAFFAYGNPGSDGSITFDENNKANANNNFVFRPQGGITESFRSNLYLLNSDSTTVLADGNLAQYDNSYSAGVDNVDLAKFGQVDESFALTRDAKRLAIERRPIISGNDTLFLSLLKTTQRYYQFQFDATSLNHPGLGGYLKDSYTGDSTQLNLNGITSINFNINADIASQDPNRFIVVFEQTNGVVPVTITGIKASQQNNGIAINWGVQNEINIKSYVVEKSTDGHVFKAITTVKASGSVTGIYNSLDENAINGENFYRIRIVGNNGTVQYSEVVKVKIGITSPSIAAYPNPVTGSILGLQFTNMPKGYYNLRLLNTVGQQIMEAQIMHVGGSVTQQVILKKGLAQGLYQLEIIKPGNTKSVINIEYK